MIVLVGLALATTTRLPLDGSRGHFGQRTSAPLPTYRTLDDRFPAPRYATRDAWSARAAYLRAHILATAGLVPMPEKTSLKPVIFGDVKRGEYVVSKVYFESLPGFFVTGNLYRPAAEGVYPAILSPHGHWTYGRLENTPTNSGPGRAINLARQGFVVFTHDMIGYGDSQQLPHTFGGRREQLWGLSLGGLQLWNSIRAIDFLETLPFVRRDAIAATGESGGGTQTFLLAAIDDRIRVAAPVNMISLHMQGGCLCENLPTLRLDTNNVEIASTIAPRPLLMISATGDWTKETMEVEYPAVRAIYQLFDAADRVHAVRIDAEHNYNRASREAMYAWMARWMKKAPADVRVEERAFTVEPLQDLLVFHQRPRPDNAVTREQLTDAWIAASKRQLEQPPSAWSFLQRREALQHVLGWTPEPPAASRPFEPRPSRSKPQRVVLLTRSDAALEALLKRRGARTVLVPFTRFDAEAAVRIRHFETYNRTPAGQQVADIVAALRANPGAALVADGTQALAAILALAAEGGGRAVLDVGEFDTSSDEDFLNRLFIPGLRRVGDLQTASEVLTRLPPAVVVHNAGPRFRVRGLPVRQEKMTTSEIADVLLYVKR
jgi:dienelactone hydrolase